MQCKFVKLITTNSESIPYMTILRDNKIIEGKMHDRANRTRIAITNNKNEIVGFFTTFEHKNIWHIGVVCIATEYQHTGIIIKSIIKFMNDKPGSIFVEDNNTSVIAALREAKFKLLTYDIEKDGGFYLNEKALDVMRSLT